MKLTLVFDDGFQVNQIRYGPPATSREKPVDDLAIAIGLLSLVQDGEANRRASQQQHFNGPSAAIASLQPQSLLNFLQQCALRVQQSVEG